ncbi:hypothetical protein MY4824_005987 [Beauveria thailandica]
MYVHNWGASASKQEAKMIKVTMQVVEDAEDARLQPYQPVVHVFN